MILSDQTGLFLGFRMRLDMGKMHQMKLWILRLCAFFSAFCCMLPASAQQNTEIILRARGTVRDAESLNDGTLFHIEYEHKSRNNKAISTFIRHFDLAGRLLSEETTTYNADGRFKKYAIDQFQTKAKGSVEVVDNTVLMTWTENGSTKTSKDDFTANTVAAGSLMAYLSPHTRSLSQGESLEVRLAVPDRGSVFNFAVAPQKADCPAQPGDLCVNLMLSNFFLKKLVNPIRMSFQKNSDGYRPLSLETPAVVRRERGKALEKFTARIDYPRL